MASQMGSEPTKLVSGISGAIHYRGTERAASTLKDRRDHNGAVAAARADRDAAFA
jgi:hypothetical protein